MSGAPRFSMRSMNCQKAVRLGRNGLPLGLLSSLWAALGR
jgi:hypothetical protein